jgi:hypothetical protein
MLAHPVFKMWIIQEPNKVILWNKRNFEERETEIMQHVKNIQYWYLLNKYLKCSVGRQRVKRSAACEAQPSEMYVCHSWCSCSCCHCRFKPVLFLPDLNKLNPVWKIKHFHWFRKLLPFLFFYQKAFNVIIFLCRSSVGSRLPSPAVLCCVLCRVLVSLQVGALVGMADDWGFTFVRIRGVFFKCKLICAS